MQADMYTIYENLGFLKDPYKTYCTNQIIKYGYMHSLEEIMVRLQKQEPIEYILNNVEFGGYTFYIDSRALIPRDDTYEIVNRATSIIKKKLLKDLTIVDVGTGSGNIIISLCKGLWQRSDIRFIGIDKSKEALEVAHINLKRLKCDKKVKLVNEDFINYDLTSFKNVVICANLPYLGELDYIAESVMQYEPHMALFGGYIGDELNKQLINIFNTNINVQALFFETKNGKIYCRTRV